MAVGLGVDIVSLDRMERVLARTPSFARTVFTPQEQEYCLSKANPARHFAARFAAKEAVGKALGVGILWEGMKPSLIEVVNDFRGRPCIKLHGYAAQVAQEQGVIDVPISLSYTHDVVVANAVAITRESQVEKEKRKDVKAELAAQFRQARSILDDLGSQTAAGVEDVADAETSSQEVSDRE